MSPKSSLAGVFEDRVLALRRGPVIPEAWQKMERRVLRDDDSYRIVVHGKLPSSDVKWDPRIVAYLMSSSAEKLKDNIRVTRAKTINLRSINMDMGVEESEEREKNFRDIALAKIDVSGQVLRDLRTKEASALAEKIDVPDLGYVLQVAEDRGAFFDPRLKDYRGFDSYRKLDMLAEIFEPDVPFPGHRFKELTSAMGGLGPFMDVLKRAYEELPREGSAYHNASHYEALSRQHQEHAGYAFKPLKADGVVPVDANGLVIEVTIKDCSFQDMTPEQKLAELKREATFEGFDFMVPKGQNQTMQESRTNPFDAWFEQDSHFAMAWKTFFDLCNVPERDKELSFEKSVPSDPKILLTGSHNKGVRKRIRSFSHPLTGAVVQAQDPLKPGLPIEHESLRLQSNAVVLLPYHNLESELDEALALVSQFRIAVEAATVKGLYDPSMSGCPIIVMEDQARNFHQKIKTLANIFYLHKFTGSKFDDLFTLVENKRELVEALQWNPLWYQGHDPAQVKVGELYNQEKLAQLTGIDDYGYIRAGLVTASCPNHKITQEAEILGYETARQRMTLFSGGGLRNGMGALTAGGIQAHYDGYEGFIQHGERWATASIKEGTLITVPRQYGLQPTAGSIDNGYVCFADWLHYHEADGYAARKHLILGPMNSGFYFGGGWGTGDEFLDVAKHNLKVLKHGEGHYPGFRDQVVGDKNRLRKPLRMIDQQLQDGRVVRYWSEVMKTLFTPKQLDMLKVSFYASTHEAIAADNLYARNLGYDVREYEPTAKPVSRWVLQSEPQLIR